MRLYLLAIVAIVLLVVVPASAEDEKETGWFNTAEVGIVVTSGNSETETLSFKEETKRVWERSEFRIKAGAIRAETTTTTRMAVDLGGGPVVTETDLTATNAEAYYLEARFDKKIHDRFFWFSGAGWDRNEPGGIDSRTTAFGGVGNIWRDGDKVKFRTDYAVSYTDQQDVVQTASSVGDYAGLRASWVYKHQFTESTEYTNDFVLDYGLDDSDNWRAGMINAVAVAINSKLALKVSLQHLYNNLPPTELLTVVDGTGTPIPLAPAVPFELDELDTIFGATLVLKF
jgi:putative salt-induced outer membrane protein YdiY